METNQRLIIIETPHRLPPTAWVADCESDFIEKVNRQIDCSCGCKWPAETLEDAHELLGHDLHGLSVLTVDEARDCLRGEGYKRLTIEERVVVEGVL